MNSEQNTDKEKLKLFLEYSVTKIKNYSLAKRIILAFGLSPLIVIPICLFVLGPSNNSLWPVKIVYKENETIQELAQDLYDKNLIRSTRAFALLAQITDQDRNLTTGTYLFVENKSVLDIIDIFVRHDTGIHKLVLTIPEGLSRVQIASLLDKKLNHFDTKLFLKETSEMEGYLFPDTYYFEPDVDQGTVMRAMRDNFDSKTKDLLAGQTPEHIERILIMASILEEEGKTYDDKVIIAGILEKRLSMHMRLQVDATFSYILGKNISSVGESELNLDSPYNTYKNYGLPPGPISNPGLESIKAALNPKSSAYLYYLTGTDGVFHYATTFEQHKKNKFTYLK